MSLNRRHYLCLTPRDRNLQPTPAQLNALLDQLIDAGVLIRDPHFDAPDPSLVFDPPNITELSQKLQALSEQYGPFDTEGSNRDYRLHAARCPVEGLQAVDLHQPRKLMAFADEIEREILFADHPQYSFYPGKGQTPIRDWFLPREPVQERHQLIEAIAESCDQLCIELNRSSYQGLIQAARMGRLRPSEYVSIERSGPPMLYIVSGLHSYSDVESAGHVHVDSADPRQIASFGEIARINPDQREQKGYVHRRFFNTTPDSLWSRFSITQICAFKPDLSEFRQSSSYHSIAKAIKDVLEQKTDFHYLEA